MFTISDELELLALQSALIEAKLPRLSEDRDISASPLVASLAERATSACRNLPEQLWPRHEAWRQLSPGHARWAPTVARALSDQDYLRKATQEQKMEYARLLLAPYNNDDDAVLRFLDYIEGILRERKWYQLWMRKATPFAGGVAFLIEESEGLYVAWDASHVEIASGVLDDVGGALLSGGFEPFGYFVRGSP